MGRAALVANAATVQANSAGHKPRNAEWQQPSGPPMVGGSAANGGGAELL